MRYLRVQEICQMLRVEEDTVRVLAEEGLIQIKRTVEGESVLSEIDADRVRVSMLLRDLDVNIAGIEIILQLREEILETQKQFDEILRFLAGELRRRLGEPDGCP